MRKLLWRLLKTFWFPILLIVLRLLGRKYPWAKNTHAVLKKAR
jgi:hypothetical protein